MTPSILSHEEQNEIRTYVHSYTRNKQPNLSSDDIRQSEVFVAALRVIDKTLGGEWSDKNVAPLFKASVSDFFRRHLTSDADRLKYTDRIIQLAEFINSLYFLPSFIYKLGDLINNGLEETFYELRVAYTLHKSHCLSEYLTPSGVKGQDYDFNAVLDSQRIAVEVKCITDEPTYSANRFRNRLKKAATQFPANMPCVIFLMLPTTWPAVKSFHNDISTAASYIFRNYSRINAIFLNWELWIDNAPPYKRGLVVTYAINQDSKIPINRIERLADQTSLPSSFDNLFLDVTFI